VIRNFPGIDTSFLSACSDKRADGPRAKRGESWARDESSSGLKS
jgi:hypothetical protein